MLLLTLCFIVSLSIEEYLITKKDKVINDYNGIFSPHCLPFLMLTETFTKR